MLGSGNEKQIEGPERERERDGRNTKTIKGDMRVNDKYTSQGGNIEREKKNERKMGTDKIAERERETMKEAARRSDGRKARAAEGKGGRY